MGYVITGIVCFALGSLSGFICLSLCVAAGQNSRQGDKDEVQGSNEEESQQMY